MRDASSSNTNKMANPYLGKTKAEMKKIYDTQIRNAGMSGTKLRKIADQMQAALKQTPKSKAKPAAAKAKPAAAKAKRPNQTTNGASLGSKLTKAEREKRAAAAKNPNKTVNGASLSSVLTKSEKEKRRKAAKNAGK